MKLGVSRDFMISPKYTALWLLAIFCLVASSSPIFVKWSEQEIGAYSTVFHRFFFGFIIFSITNSVSSRASQKADKENDSVEPDSLEINNIPYLLLAGLCAACNQIFWAVSLTQTSVGSSALLHSLSPLFTAIFAWLFLAEEIKSQLLLGMMIAIGGSVLLTAGDFQVSASKLQGDGLALLSAVFFAGYLTIVGRLRMHLGSGTILVWRCLTGATLVAPLLIFNSDSIIPASASGWLAILGMVSAFAISHWLLTLSLAVLSSTLVAIVLLIDPLLSSIQAWFFFSEKMQPLDWVSMSIVILGICLAITSISDKEVEDDCEIGE